MAAGRRPAQLDSAGPPRDLRPCRSPPGLMMPIASTVADPPPILEHATIRSIVIGIMLAMFLAALDQTIVATALPTIGRELGDLAHLPWVFTAYLVAATAITPLYGKFSDIHGRRITLLVAIVTFMAGSMACAL